MAENPPAIKTTSDVVPGGQFLSSELSPQSLLPSHFLELRIHFFPFEQRNSPDSHISGQFLSSELSPQSLMPSHFLELLIHFFPFEQRNSPESHITSASMLSLIQLKKFVTRA